MTKLCFGSSMVKAAVFAAAFSLCALAVMAEEAINLRNR